jgi:hypothetical protein
MIEQLNIAPCPLSHIDTSISTTKYNLFGDMGSIRVSLSSNSAHTHEASVIGNLKKGGILFTPGIRPEQMLNTLRLTKA